MRSWLVMALLLVTRAASADVAMKTESWANNQKAFDEMARRIDEGNMRNLLARPGVKAFGDLAGQVALVDGLAGVPGGEGRVFIDGHPSVVAFYLGKPQAIHEVGFFTYNVDSRANQDFEVRLVDNSANPGQMPKFADAPTCTTGDKIIGPEAGGFHTSFVASNGGTLTPGKADWVEFRIWRTYPTKVGQPAKTKTPQSATSGIELEVLGDPKDVLVMSPEAKARAAALREKGNRPPYEKKATWQESMQASREAILRWECEIDDLVTTRAGITLGSWRTLGALPAGSEDVRQIERLAKVDITKPLALKGKELTWRECAVKDGEMADLAAMFKAKPGDVVVLCRPISTELEFAGRDGLSMGVGMTGGRIKVLGGQSSLSQGESSGPAVPNQRDWSLREKPGQYHMLATLPVGKDGRCQLWLMPQPPISKPGAGNKDERIARRMRLYDQLKNDFTDSVSLAQMKWERWDSIWVRFEKGGMSSRHYFYTDWAPGNPSPLVDQYNTATDVRIADVEKELKTIEPAIATRVAPWLATFKTTKAPDALAVARARYYAVATVQTAMSEHHKIESMRLAVKDQQKTFAERYPKGAEYIKRIDALEAQMVAAWPAVIAGNNGALTTLLAVRDQAATEARDILLSNPVLAFDRLLLGKGGPGFASNWGGPNHIGSELVTLSPVRPDGKITTVYKGNGGISDMDLSFDAKKILFSENVRIHEVNTDGTGHRQISSSDDKHTKHYDAARLPNGKIMFVSTACEQAVPCTGEWYVGNMHVMDDDGKNERRLCFDQDHDWNPAVLNNGTVIYTRWEYTDTPHYFTRLLFTMNPDGSNQTALYHSNSYWPNAVYWPRAIPGHPSQIVGIVSGHHGVSRVGEVVIFDPALGQHEAEGAVHRIGDRGKRVEAVIEDALVSYTWPRFAWPYPLAEGEANRGAGKYFLVNCQMDEHAPWGIYLVDVFDNMTPLLMGNYAQPIPLKPRPTPPVVPTRVDPKKTDAQVYMVDIYRGGSLRNYPKGSVKALRIGAHDYRYGGNGDTYAVSFEGGWDVKRILGTVPVEADGSAFFKVPANTPIFVQPLDADGKALQVMRSWFTAMPGEVLSCVGCHEKNETAPAIQTIAALRGPSEIKPWFGPARGFGFDHEVQPVLDHRCVGCHDGQPRKDNQRLPDFRAKQIRPDFKGNYSPAYMALAPYVRRPGYESDYRMPIPAEFHASTSPLIQMLEKGHHNVQLTREEQERIYTWIDFNVPYAPNWGESHRAPEQEQVDRRAKYKSLFANVSVSTEAPLPLPPIAAFERPAAEPTRPAALKLEGWPLTAEQAADMQKRAGREISLDLGNGITMPLAAIPAGKFVMGDVNGLPDEYPQAPVAITNAFHIGRMEVTNHQYALFDPSHDSAYIDARGKDRISRGYPVNEPDQPVVRITWHQAMAFCRWLSAKTGQDCTLPTEAQWEWACRAGSATAWSFGDAFAGQNNLANIADSSLGGWAWGRVDGGYSDGAHFSVPGGRYKPNTWGLCDMHGNVAEWTLTDYRAYPYVDSDGRNAAGSTAPKVVRGGSWNDKFQYSRSASRLQFPPHQPIYNVGFRIVCKPAGLAKGE